MYSGDESESKYDEERDGRTELVRSFVRSPVLFSMDSNKVKLRRGRAPPRRDAPSSFIFAPLEEIVSVRKEKSTPKRNKNQMLLPPLQSCWAKKNKSRRRRRPAPIHELVAFPCSLASLILLCSRRRTLKAFALVPIFGSDDSSFIAAAAAAASSSLATDVVNAAAVLLRSERKTSLFPCL